jgi:hypothetical protein
LNRNESGTEQNKTQKTQQIIRRSNLYVITKCVLASGFLLVSDYAIDGEYSALPQINNSQIHHLKLQDMQFYICCSALQSFRLTRGGVPETRRVH